MEIAGHIFGVISIGLFFLTYQVFDKKKLLAVLTAATVAICLQYLFLGAYSGFALNIVCLIRNFFYYWRKRETTFGKIMPVLFAVLIGVMSLFSWDGWFSVFILAGLVINTLCVGYCDSQQLRKSILVTCPMVIVYNAFTMSYAAIISEVIGMVSGVIGIVRYNRAKRNAEPAGGQGR